MTQAVVSELQALEPATAEGPSLSTLIADLASMLRDRGFPILAVVRPDPLGDGPGRALHAITSHAFERHHDLLLSLPGKPTQSIYSLNLTNPMCAWSMTFFGLGYQTALIVRVPILGEETFDFVMFTPGLYVRDDHAHACAFEVFRNWGVWREAIREECCPLTAREREALKAVAQGLKGAEACELIGYTERTFRLHVDNAKRKMKAGNVSQAVHRAHLLCGL